MRLKGVLSEKPYYNQFLVLVGVALISTGIGLVLWTLSVPFIFGISLVDMPTMMADISNPEVLNAQQYLLIIQDVFVFILPAWITAYIISENPAIYLRIKQFSNWKMFLLAAVTMLAASPFIEWMGYVNSQMSLPLFLKDLEDWMKQAETQMAELTQVLLTFHSEGDLLFKLLLIAALPALGEEFIFRGILQRLFNKWFRNKHAAIIFTAVLFSAMHMQFYGFLPRFVMGVYLGYLFEFSGSLWVPVLAHFINNGAAVLQAYYNPQLLKEDATATPNMLWVTGSVIAVVVLVACTQRLRVKTANASS